MPARVELRLALRQTRRAWPVSLLVIALVALPMMLIAGGATFLSSRTASVADEITAELGASATMYRIVGGEDPSRTQSLDDPGWWQVDWDEHGEPVNPELPAPEDLDGLLDDPALLVVVAGEVTAVTPGGTARIHALVGDAADIALAGRYELLEGVRPVAADEAAVSPGALERLGAQLGDTLELADPAATLTIVGVMKTAVARDAEQTILLPAEFLGAVDPGPMGTLWFSPQHQPDRAQVEVLNRAGVVVHARDFMTSGDGGSMDPSSAWALTSTILIVGGFTAYMVILLAGAGFAVSAKRQERSLAIAASVGAGRGSVFRIVLLQGALLGLVGGVVGAVVGIASAYPALMLLDDGAASSFWGFRVPWPGITGIVLFATAIGTASALVPARAATRGDVLASLRGSRKPAAVRVDRPFWGSLAIVIGLAITIAGGLTLAALNAADTIDYSNPLRTLCVIGIVVGPILFQIGAILAGHWLLSLIARAAARLGLAPRIAARDAAAHPSRIVPAFAAIAACVFIASFALTAVNVFTQQQARNWWYQAPLGSVAVWAWGEHPQPILAEAETALERTDPAHIAEVRFEVSMNAVDPETPSETVTAEVFDYVDCDAIESGACMDRATALFGTGSPVVVEPDDLATVLGTAIDQRTREAFAAGGAIALDPNHLDGQDIVLHRWDRADTDWFYHQWSPTKPLPEPLDSARVPAQSVTPPHRLDLRVILSPAAADAFGFETEVQQLIASYDAPPTQESLDALALVADIQGTSGAGFNYRHETGPPSPAPWLWLILGAAGVLVLGAGGVALGLARIERRPDDATLSAVGAGIGLRRGIAAWQALIVVGIGSVTGTVAGLIPMAGIVLQSQTDLHHALRMSDAPWLWLGLLAIGLPVAVAAVSWLIPPRRADLTRRAVIA